MNKIQRQAAIACFTANERLSEVMVTEDGNCFTSQNLCDNHVRECRLDKSATVTVTRDEVINSGKTENQTQTGPKPFSKMTLAELTETAALKEIEVPEGATKKQIIELLDPNSDSDDAEKGGEV